jgi:hypothetical protein
MAALVCVLLLLCAASTTIGSTIHKLILQRTILLISHNSLRLCCCHQRCVVACIVTGWSTNHDQILSLVLSATQLRSRSWRWIRNAISNMLDRLIHIGCTFLAALLWCDNLNTIGCGNRSIWMNPTWKKWLIHLFHKGIEQYFSFFTAQYISLILDSSCWRLFLFTKAPFHRSLISLVRGSTSVHNGLSIRWRFHIVRILWLLLLLSHIGWLPRWCVIILHDNHHHPASFPLRLRLLLLIVMPCADIYILIWIIILLTLRPASPMWV